MKMSCSSSDSDTPQLSAHSFAALQEFYAENAPEYTSTVQEDWVR